MLWFGVRRKWTWSCFSKIGGRIELVIFFLSWGLFMTQGSGWLRLKVFCMDVEQGKAD